MALATLETSDAFDKAVDGHCLIHFFASWYEPCTDMDALLTALAPKATASLALLRVARRTTP